MSEPIHINIEPHGMGATHNLMCWLCGLRKAFRKYCRTRKATL